MYVYRKWYEITHLQHIKFNSSPLLLSFFFFTDNQLSLIFSKPVPKLSHLHCYQLDKVLHNIAFDCFHGIEHKILYNTESKISKQTFGTLYTAISWI